MTLRIIRVAVEHNKEIGNTISDIVEVAPGSIITTVNNKNDCIVFIDTTQWQFKDDSKFKPTEEGDNKQDELEKNLRQDQQIRILYDHLVQAENTTYEDLLAEHLEWLRGELEPARKVDFYSEPISIGIPEAA